MGKRASAISALTSGKRLFKNVLLNLLGLGVPLIAAVVAIPVLLSKLGDGKFGFLTLAWATVGYLGVLDLGIGRALTKTIAERLGQGRDSDVGPLVWSGVLGTTALGLLLAAGIALGSDWLVVSWLGSSPELRGELTSAIILLAISVPFLAVGSSLRGVLEAYQRFDLVNLVRAPIGVLNYIGPLLAALYSADLRLVVLSVVLTRALAALVYGYLCATTIGARLYTPSFSMPVLVGLMKFGGWITVIGIVNPLLVILDRFVLTAVSPLETIVFYTVPAEVVSKLWLLPSAVLMVMLPAFSTLGSSDPQRTDMLFSNARWYLLIAMIPVCLISVGASFDILSWWVGRPFAEKSYHILQFALIGFFLNALSYVPYAYLQGSGNPRLMVQIFCIELVLYPPFLWILASKFGALGAATASLVRFALESVAFYVAAHTVAKFPFRKSVPFGAVALCVAMVLSGVATLDRSYQLTASLVLLLPYATAVWIWFKRDGVLLGNKQGQLRNSP
jgi:O-antigen/teichoic acid export membrane protein